MLPFSLAIIVIIFALCQEISLEPQKKRLKEAYERCERRKAEGQLLLAPKQKEQRTACVYRIVRSTAPICFSTTPKFPR